MSKRQPDKEDLLTERRKKVVNLRKKGLSMSRIAIELGTSIDCVFRDVKAVRRFQASTADTSIAPEEVLKCKEPSGKPRNLRRRAKNRYSCITCGESWTGKGSWKPARLHESGEHVVIQGASQKGVERAHLARVVA